MKIMKFFISMILIFCAYFLYTYKNQISYYYNNFFKISTYKSFSVRIPDKYQVLGIDVSRYQGWINWPMVSNAKQGDKRLSFVYMKASEGNWYVDPFYSRNSDQAIKSRLYSGAYHYYRFDKDPKKQMQHFAKLLKNKDFSLPPAIDVEETHGASRQKIVKDLRVALKYLEELTKREPIIYSSPSFYFDYLNKEFDDYDYWIAHYYVRKPKIPRNVSAQFWQLSDKSTIDGINHPVDLNVFLFDSEKFKRYVKP